VGVDTETAVSSQLALAKQEAGRLREEEGRTAREQYRLLLAFVEKRCPAVFLQLNGKTLYELLRKGSQPVSGEVLREYRAKAAMRMEARPDLPVPDEVRQSLGDSLAAIWESAFHVARREATELAEVRNAALLEKVEGLARENERLRAELAAHSNAETERAAQLEAAQGEKARLTEEVAALSATLTRMADERDSAQEALAGAQRTFNARIEDLLRTIGVAQEAREADSKRALLEVDLARTETRKLQKRLDDALERTAAVETVLGQRTQSLGESQRALTELGSQLARLAAQQPVTPAVARKHGGDSPEAVTEPGRSVRPARQAKMPAQKTAAAPEPAAVAAKRRSSSKRKARSS
jgi:predicted  nucleic acid-binding Zn-ribbon protein